MPKEENEKIRQALKDVLEVRDAYDRFVATSGDGEQQDRMMDRLQEVFQVFKEILLAIPPERREEVWLDAIIFGLIDTYGDVTTKEGRRRLMYLLGIYITDSHAETEEYWDSQDNSGEE
jgi:hypothetical protein